MVNPNTVGACQPGRELKVVDPETGRVITTPNTVGECWVRGPEVSPGYYNRPEANRENFTEDGFCKTGDAVYFDEKGLFHIVDRYKEMIKVDAQQVAPVELESLLLAHPAVQEAGVVGVKSDVHGQAPRAYVVLKEAFRDSDLEKLKTELVQHVNDQAVDWKKLRGGVEFTDAVPKIGAGKINRAQLKKMASN